MNAAAASKTESNRLSFLPSAAAWMLFGFLAAASLLFAARRLAGGFTTTASPAWIVLTGAALCVGVYLIRRGLFEGRDFGTVLPHVPTLAAVIIGLSIWMPGSSLYAVGLFWVLILFGEFVRLGPLLERGAKPRVHSVTTYLAPKEPPVVLEKRAAGEGLREEECADEMLSDEEIAELGATPPGDQSLGEEPLREQLTRSQTEDGREHIEGVVRVRFEPGQRIGHAHIPFCPAFLGEPEFECEPVEGPEGRVKATHVQPFGVRIEAKLAEDAAEETSIWVGFSAVGSQ